MKRLMILASALLLVLSGSCGKADVTITPEEDNTEKQPRNGGSNDSGSVKVLVAYFSFTNTTKGIAASIAEIAGADVYEIVPEVAYGTENSDYYNESTRAYKDITWGSGRKLNGSGAPSGDELKSWINANL